MEDSFKDSLHGGVGWLSEKLSRQNVVETK